MAIGPDSGFYNALSLATDIVVVNALTILTSLPLVTVGASLRAANVVIAQLIAEEGSRPTRTYLNQFRREWKTSTLWSLILTVIGVLALYEFWIIGQAEIEPTVSFMLRAGIFSGLIVLGGISFWFFYFEAHRPRAFKETFTAAALSAIRYLPRTLVGVALIVAPLVFVVIAPSRWVVVLFYFLVIGIAFSIYLFQLAARGTLSR